MPVANIFNSNNPNREWKFESGVVKKGEVLLLIGAGVQAEFEEGDWNVTGAEERRKISVDNFRHSDATHRFLRVLENASNPMLVRGGMTLKTIIRARYNHGMSAGCPSLFLNEDVRLGKTLEAKYARLRERIGDKNLKVGINLPTHPPFLVKFLIKLFREYQNSFIYLQGSTDAGLIHRLGGDMSRIRMFEDVEEWSKRLSEMDVVLGGRIHGNMLALGVSVLVFVIAPDYRVLELAQRMKIPHMTAFDDRLSEESFDIADFMYRNKMNGADFDDNRCGIAKIYRKVFFKYGFDASSHVRRISEIC